MEMKAENKEIETSKCTPKTPKAEKVPKANNSHQPENKTISMAKYIK